VAISNNFESFGLFEAAMRARTALLPLWLGMKGDSLRSTEKAVQETINVELGYLDKLKTHRVNHYGQISLQAVQGLEAAINQKAQQFFESGTMAYALRRHRDQVSVEDPYDMDQLDGKVLPMLDLLMKPPGLQNFKRSALSHAPGTSPSVSVFAETVTKQSRLAQMMANDWKARTYQAAYAPLPDKKPLKDQAKVLLGKGYTTRAPHALKSAWLLSVGHGTGARGSTARQSIIATKQRQAIEAKKAKMDED
jgi:hypothetical protein